MGNVTENSILELLESRSLVRLHISNAVLKKEVIGEILFYDEIRRIIVVAEDENRISVYDYHDIVSIDFINDCAEKFLTIGNKSRYYDEVQEAIGIKSSGVIDGEQDWESALTHYDKALLECGFDDQILSNYVYTVKGILLNNGDDEECVQKKFRVLKGFKNMLEDERYELKGLTKYGLKSLTNSIDTNRLNNYAVRIVEEIRRRVGDPREKMSGKDGGMPVYHGIDMELWVTAEIISVHIEIFKGKLKGKEANSIKEDAVQRIEEVKSQYKELQNCETQGFISDKPIKFFDESIKRIKKINDDENLDDEVQSLYAKLFRIMLFQAQFSMKEITPSSRKKSDLLNEAGINKAIGQLILLYKCFDMFFTNIKDARWRSIEFESRWQLRVEILACYALKYQINNTDEKLQEYCTTIDNQGFFEGVDFKDCPVSKSLPMLKYFVQLKMYDRVCALGEFIISGRKSGLSARIFACYAIAKYHESNNFLSECYRYLTEAKSINIGEKDRKACNEIDAGMLKDIDKMYSNYASTEDILSYHTEILEDILRNGKSDIENRKKSEYELGKVMDWVLDFEPGHLSRDFLDVTIKALKEFRYERRTEVKEFLRRKVPGIRLNGIEKIRADKELSQKNNLRREIERRFAVARQIYKEKIRDNGISKNNFFKMLLQLDYFDKEWGMNVLKSVLNSYNMFFFIGNSDTISCLSHLSWGKDDDLMEYLLNEVRIYLDSVVMETANAGVAKFLEFVGDNLSGVEKKIEAFDMAINRSKIEKRSDGDLCDRITIKKSRAENERDSRGYFNLLETSTLDELRENHDPCLVANFFQGFWDENGFKFMIHGAWKSYDKDGTPIVNNFPERVSMMNNYFRRKIAEYSEAGRKLPRWVINQMAGFIAGEYNGEPVSWTGFDGKLHTEGYAHEDWKRWMDEHPLQNPYDERSFTDFINNTFRASIRFKSNGRREASEIQNRMQDLLKECGIAADEYEFDAEVVDFYTNVLAFLESADRIFREANTLDNKKNLKIEIKGGDGGKVIIVVTDRNSLVSYVYDEDRFRRLQGDNGTIARNCVGYCDFAVEARCRDQRFLRYNYLSAEGRPDVEEIGTNPEGFKFVFTFYTKDK